MIEKIIVGTIFTFILGVYGGEVGVRLGILLTLILICLNNIVK